MFPCLNFNFYIDQIENLLIFVKLCICLIIGGPSVADVTDFEKAPLGFGQNYTDTKKAPPVCSVKVSKIKYVYFIKQVTVVNSQLII